jgi:hypothetical protein
MIAREHVHAFQRQPVSGAGIEGCHRAALPAKNCFELGDSRPSVGCALFCEHHVHTPAHLLLGRPP